MIPSSSTGEKIIIQATGIGLVYILVAKPILQRMGIIEDDAARKRREEEDRIWAESQRAVKPPSTPVTPDINYGQFNQFMDKMVYANTANVRVRKSARSNADVLVVLNAGQKAGYFYSVATENLGGKVKTWVWLVDVNKKDLGWVPLAEIRL